LGGGGLRRDPVTGKWSVLAPGRGGRPSGEAAPAPCPFCAGNEHLTPPEVDALRPSGGAADGPGWTVRVVPNKYPVFAGGHEVIVHSPEHEAALADLSSERLTDVLDVCRRRIASHLAAGAPSVTLIVNQGFGAGASLAHPHMQLFATPIVPSVLVEECANFAAHAVTTGRCLLCDVVARTRDDVARLVVDDATVAWVPEAARWPYELWLAPARHERDFVETDVALLAPVLRRALRAVSACTGDAPLNWWLHTAPATDDRPFHWHLEIAPRLTAIAGFELATDMAICVVDPAVAASRLRDALDGRGGQEA
jgi:UDPglucose--hexose-1-phosphate uridylyltransferase